MAEMTVEEFKTLPKAHQNALVAERVMGDSPVLVSVPSIGEGVNINETLIWVVPHEAGCDYVPDYSANDHVWAAFAEPLDAKDLFVSFVKAVLRIKAGGSPTSQEQCIAALLAIGYLKED